MNDPAINGLNLSYLIFSGGTGFVCQLNANKTTVECILFNGQYIHRWFLPKFLLYFLFYHNSIKWKIKNPIKINTPTVAKVILFRIYIVVLDEFFKNQIVRHNFRSY